MTRCIAALTLGSAYRLSGDVTAASQTFAKAVETYKKSLYYALKGKGKQLPTAGLLSIGLSEILFE